MSKLKHEAMFDRMKVKVDAAKLAKERLTEQDMAYDKCQFKVISGKLTISDPCYTKDTWCAGEIVAENGWWFPTVQIVSMGCWGDRVVELCAKSELYFKKFGADYEDDYVPPVWNDTGIDVGVDSGQCGIFDSQHYRDDSMVEGVYRLTKSDIGDRDGEGESWYGLCCDRTLSFYKWGIVPYGCVSSSGCGDGSYTAFAVKDYDGNAIAIKIIYIPIEVKELNGEE